MTLGIASNLHPDFRRLGLRSPKPFLSYLADVVMPALAPLGFPPQLERKRSSHYFERAGPGWSFVLLAPQLAYGGWEGEVQVRPSGTRWKPTIRPYLYQPGEVRFMLDLYRPARSNQLALYLEVQRIQRPPHEDNGWLTMCIEYKSRGRLTQLLAAREERPEKLRLGMLHVLSATQYYLSGRHFYWEEEKA